MKIREMLGWFFVLGLVFVVPLYAAMSDPAALNLVRSLWGDQASIATFRDQTASNWTRQIGVKSTNCKQKFTVLGSGFNTWDAAFADATANPPAIKGPFKANIVITAAGVSSGNPVAALTQWIDDIKVSTMIFDPPAQSVSAPLNIDTRILSPGVHVICGQSLDATGATVGTSPAFLFRVER